MSFLLPIALLLGLTIALPIFAHALRKGQARAIDFPAARLVLERKSSAEQRHRLEDRFLLLLRVLLLLCLTLLAASPFVRCSRLALSRTDGASVAAALVIDDSASMRARLPSGKTRLEVAIKGALELLDTARPGDSFSIILAGYPARVLTPSTTDLTSVRDALETIPASDRRTDLTAALDLARSLQSDVPQADRPIVLLSDMSIAGSLDLTGVMVPATDLGRALENCALLDAVRVANAVQVEVACTSAEAIAGRTIRILGKDGSELAPPVAAKDGVVKVPLPDKSAQEERSPERAILSAPKNPQHDMISNDDGVVVLESSAALSVALRVDQGKAGHKTGSSTVVQAAIEALERGVRVQTINLLPDSASDLQSYGALFVDDPSGFTPEVSEAIAAWVRQGGVGMVLVGPSVTSTPLGSTFAPFLESSVKWESTTSKGTDAKIAGTLGPLTTTWADLGAKSRAHFSAEEGTSIKTRWDDGMPLVLERPLGRGLLLTVALPASVDHSDLALRPAFLELMDYAITQCALRRGAQATLVGEHWSVDTSAVVRGPDGAVLPHFQKPSSTESSLLHSYVEPPVAGRYTIASDDAPKQKPLTRVAMLDRTEQVTGPNESLKGGGSDKQKATLTKVGISREIALLALIFGVLELAFRAVKRARSTRPLQSAVS